MDQKPMKISADMTVLDVVSSFRGIEQAFKKYDDQAGVCICCQALFDPLEKVAVKFDLDLSGLLEDLETTAREIVEQKESR